MKTTYTLLAMAFSFSVAVNGQVVPAATGPGGLGISGDLQYSMRYTQSAEHESDGTNYQTAKASADVEYANEKERLPFSLNYVGGYSWTLDGPGELTGLFQHLSLSQGFVWRTWTATFDDDVSYRPQAPTTGFSGIPGIGEPIGGSNPFPPSSQSILTLKTHTVNHVVDGVLEHNIDYATTVSVGGGSELLR